MVCLVSLVQPNKRDRPDKPYNVPLTLTDCFSILLGVTFKIKYFTFSIEPIIEGVAGAGSPLQIEIIGSLGDADL
jgi:hypothetical protein